MEGCIVCGLDTRRHLPLPERFSDPNTWIDEHPDFGDPVEVRSGEVPVFWACGVTPQAVALASKPAFMITHSPGHMFITDLPNHTLAAL